MRAKRASFVQFGGKITVCISTYVYFANCVCVCVFWVEGDKHLKEKLFTLKDFGTE